MIIVVGLDLPTEPSWLARTNCYAGLKVGLEVQSAPTELVLMAFRYSLAFEASQLLLI